MSEPVVLAKTRVPPSRALQRARVHAIVATAWSTPLTLVVAPAGSGKTTLLAQFATAGIADGKPVAWYQAESAEGDVANLLRHLEGSLRSAVPGLQGGWATVPAAAAELDTRDGPPTALVVDDLHALAGTPAEAALEQLIAYLPPWLHVVTAARRPPSFNLSRLRVSNQLHEIGPDDLRFRSWEVEELFRDHYRQPLAPEELAELARRTDGWAAGLQLFHLATRGKATSERRRVLASLSSRLRDVREYLTRNILHDLDDELRQFLVQTSVLGRLSGPWCDQLLERSGSDRVLADIEQRHLFLTSDDGGATYREHEVLRSHLEELLVEELGEAATRERHRLAGRILEDAGAVSEALRAYCRAQDWLSAERVLGRAGDRVFDRPGTWIEPLPPALSDHDAWLLLGTARRQLAAGDWQAALVSYRRGEEAFGGALAAETCRRERFSLTGWMDPTAAVSVDWTGALRRAFTRDPLGVAHDLLDRPEPIYGDAATALTAGLAALAGGDVDLALRLFTRATDASDVSANLVRFADLASGAAACLLRRPDAGRSMMAAVEKVEPVVAPWLGRLLTSVAGGRISEVLVEAEAARAQTAEVANTWVDAVLDFVVGTSHLLAGTAGEAGALLMSSSDGFQRVGAPVLAAWASALGCLAASRAGANDATDRAAAAQLARSAACPGALALVMGATPDTDSPIDLGWLVQTTVPFEAGPSDEPIDHDAVVVDLRCFLRFEINVNQRPVDVGLAKPRVRSLLHVLSVHAGRPVHRDHLLAMLWPDDDARSATRSLQVAISALRQLFERESGPGAGAALVRRGDGYLLAVGPEDADCLVFTSAVERGRGARLAADREEAVAALGLALATYRGDLLAEEGSAEWLLEPRDRYRMSAAEAAQSLADCLLEAGDAAGAVAACERGLEIDRYRDGLWRALIAAHEHKGDPVSAARASRSYQGVLDELGIKS
jgi:DNA-binding SARP family transcriptional activator